MAAPIDYSLFTGISPIYERVRDEPGAVIAELPFPDPSAAFANARYMLDSTRNWKPLLNGYSGFLPPSYRTHYDALAGFPDARSVRALQVAGVTHAFVHVDQLGPAAGALDRLPALRRIDADGSLVLFRIVQGASAGAGSTSTLSASGMRCA